MWSEGHYVKICQPQNRKYIVYHNAATGEDRAMVMGNMHNNWWFGCVVFEICERTDRQTDKQT